MAGTAQAPEAPSPGGLAIIGGGNLGEALLTGLLQAEPRMYAPEHILLVERDTVRAARQLDTFGISVADLAQAADRAQTLIIAVKPYHVDTVLTDLAGRVSEDHLIVSVVGGISIERIEKRLGGRAAVVRCMPNTPIAVGAGVTAISPGTKVSANQLDRVSRLFATVGNVYQVPQEQLDAVTALSGSGPAYLFMMVEAMTDAGVLLGLTRPLAESLVTGMVAGSGLLLRDAGADAIQLRSAVSSPGGTTVAALRELEDRGFRSALLAAAEAARNRSVELGQGEGH
jgi:pyrroline-5-carboxylate reductase